MKLFLYFIFFIPAALASCFFLFILTILELREIIQQVTAATIMAEKRWFNSGMKLPETRLNGLALQLFPSSNL